MVRLTTRLPAFGLQVVRCFEDEDVHHVNGKVDPAEDAETINFELALADVAQIEKRLERLKKGRAKTKEEQASNEVTLHLSMQLSCPSAGVLPGANTCSTVLHQRKIHYCLLLPCISMYHTSSLAVSTKQPIQSIAAILQCMGAIVPPLCNSYEKPSLSHDREPTCLLCTLKDLCYSLSHPYQE